MNRTYLQILIDTLRKKQEIMEELYRLTQVQSEILGQMDFDEDAFEETLQKKEIRIRELQKCDEGFDRTYQYVRDELLAKKELYQKEGRKLQELIRACTEAGIRMESLEQQNKARFERAVFQKRQSIGQFYVKNQVAHTYNRYMVNQHQEGNSYFMDKKK